jgi:cytochrome c oxidase subunit 2
MFFTMIVWHSIGEQNLSNEAYQISPDTFAERTEAMVEKFQVREEGDTGVPVVHPPAETDIYMLARTYEWWPRQWTCSMVSRCNRPTSTSRFTPAMSWL